jgi:acetyl esterase/lipase
MPLDPRARRFLNVLAAGNPASILESDVAERRLAHAELMKFAGPTPALEALEERVMPGPGGDLALRIYTPAASPSTATGASPATLPGLVYFHGGGLISGSARTHDAVAAALANAGGCRVVSVDYRLAPEHRFPAAVEDALAAVRFVAEHTADFHISPGQLAIGGDSAGATLAAVTTQRLAREAGPALVLQLLICPLLDHLSTSRSREELAYGYLVDRDTFAHDLKYYLPPGADPADPRISPLRAADFAGLPLTLVHTAEFDPLRDEGRQYAERLAAAGTAAVHTCHPGMIHLFYGLGAVIPYARTAYELMGAQLRSAFAGRGAPSGLAAQEGR